MLAICYKEKLQRWLGLSYGIIPIHQKDAGLLRRLCLPLRYVCSARRVTWAEEDKIAYLSGSFGEGGGTTFVEINKVKKIFDNSYTFNLPSNGIEDIIVKKGHYFKEK